MKKNNDKVNSGKKLFKVMRNIITLISIVIILMIIVGFTYEKRGLYSDSKKYNVPGKLVEVDGDDMHIFGYVRGDSTVVLYQVRAHLVLMLIFILYIMRYKSTQELLFMKDRDMDIVK